MDKSNIIYILYKFLSRFVKRVLLLFFAHQNINVCTIEQTFSKNVCTCYRYLRTRALFMNVFVFADFHTPIDTTYITRLYSLFFLFLNYYYTRRIKTRFYTVNLAAARVLDFGTYQIFSHVGNRHNIIIFFLTKTLLCAMTVARCARRRLMSAMNLIKTARFSSVQNVLARNTLFLRLNNL